jgi:hypothetical protein
MVIDQQVKSATNVRLVYTLAMAKYICVQPKDVQAPVRVEADTLEKGSQVFTLKEGARYRWGTWSQCGHGMVG